MSETKKPEKLVVILAEIDATRRGKADVARRVQYLSENFDVVILTSSASACRSLFPKTKVIGLRTMNTRGGLLLFCIACWFVLCLMRTRLVYVAELACSPAIIFTRRRRIVCYGNTHPLQHIMLAGRGIPLVKHLSEFLSRTMLSFGIRRCTEILAISPMLAQSYIDLGAANNRVKTVPVGVDLNLALIHQAGPRNGIFIAVSHGTISVERGLKLMIEAVNMLIQRMPDLRLRLVGATDSAEHMIRELTTKTAAESHIDVLPPVPNDQIPGILAECHCGISLLEPSPYFEASPPIKVVEFLAAGLPVIANDLPSHRLYLKNLLNAMIVDYSAQSLASALENLIRDEDLRMRLSSGAKKKALELSDEVGLRELRKALIGQTDGQ
jgi:glycosyltransferase involved in cell wall biosynthesis